MDPRKKLVCSQPDGSLQGSRGYCSTARDQEETCECTDDCNQVLPSNECVCVLSDLAYSQDNSLANCTIYTQKQWKNYIKHSRNAAEYQPMPPASNTPDGKNLLFSTQDQHLAWPITDGQDLGDLLIHGPHCFEMVEFFNQQVLKNGKLNNAVDDSHYDHCRRLILRVLSYYTDTEPNYKFQPKSLCRDFYSNGNEARHIPQNKITYTGSISYGQERRRETVDNDVQLSHDVYNNIQQELNEKTDNNVSQKTLLDRISGQNLGDLFVKNWLEQTLTSHESALVSRWESEEVVRLAALGIYCVQGNGRKAPAGKLRSLLTIE